MALFAAGCSSIEYKVRESFGQQKRELLVDRVETAKDSQEEAKEQFVSALEQFKSLTGFQGGDLEEKYEQVQAEYDRCAERAADVSERIDAVGDVANALFREWEGEIEEYSSDALRRDSERKLEETKRSYVRLMEVMGNAESRMAPVLGTLKDQVLYLKHNLNARAIASLGNVSTELQRDIDVLVADMEKAIDDAARFIEEMRE
ncbi:MAG: DUF2959 domain-containing protein [Opitutaceae bacterium]